MTLNNLIKYAQKHNIDFDAPITVYRDILTAYDSRENVQDDIEKIGVDAKDNNLVLITTENANNDDWGTTILDVVN